MMNKINTTAILINNQIFNISSEEADLLCLKLKKINLNSPSHINKRYDTAEFKEEQDFLNKIAQLAIRTTGHNAWLNSTLTNIENIKSIKKESLDEILESIGYSYLQIKNFHVMKEQ